MRDVVAEIASAPEAKDHWIFGGGGPRSLVVVLGADRGLAGAFNINVHRAADELLRELETGGPEPDVIAVGRRVRAYFHFRDRALAESLESMSDRPRFEDAQQVVEVMARELETGDIGQIFMVYTHFLSMGSQRVREPAPRPARTAAT